MGRMNGRHLSAEERNRIKETVEKHIAAGGTATSAARELNMRDMTVRKVAKEYGLMETERPTVEASYVPPSNMPAAELVAHLAARSRSHRARFNAEKNRRLKINTTDPFALVWFTDVHLGDPGTDYDTLLSHCKMVNEAPHAFGVFMGDASNNWPTNGRLAKKWADQETTKDQERQLVEWFLHESGVPWLFWALGNHDSWGDGETILRLINADLVPMASWGAKVTLEMATGRECKMDLAHDHKGSSIWNALHAETRAAQTGPGADFIFSGHRHNAALHFEEFVQRGQSTWLMRAKGYKQADDYAFVNGFPEQKEGHAGVTVIDPKTDRANPIVYASLDVGEGLDYLAFKRRAVGA